MATKINWKHRYDLMVIEIERVRAEAAIIKEECSRLLSGCNEVIARQQNIIQYLESREKHEEKKR